MQRFVGLVRRYSDYGALKALVEGVESVSLKGGKNNNKKQKPKVKTPVMLERELRKVNERFYPGIKGVNVGEMYSLLGRVRGAGKMKNAFTGSAYNCEQLQTIMSSNCKNGQFLPTVMLLGRCNSGKSSIINALVGTEVARVKRYAGLTPCINVYTVADKFCVVDTPGYGVKGAPWQGQLVMDAIKLLKTNGSLRKVFIVADAARGTQVSEYDLAVYDMLAGVDVFGDNLCTVLNKCDLLKTDAAADSATTAATTATTASATASAYSVQSGSPVLCVSASLGTIGTLLWAVTDAVGVGVKNGPSLNAVSKSRESRVVESRERAKREIAIRRADRRNRDCKLK